MPSGGQFNRESVFHVKQMGAAGGKMDKKSRMFHVKHPVQRMRLGKMGRRGSDGGVVSRETAARRPVDVFHVKRHLGMRMVRRTASSVSWRWYWAVMPAPCITFMARLTVLRKSRTSRMR